MAEFFTSLMSSIFTPGPTPTLLIATNASFAGLQLVLVALLLATYSVHFIILSILCAGLWWAINWFARELHAADEKEEKAKKPREIRMEKDEKDEGSGTETEGGEEAGRSFEGSRIEGVFSVKDKEGELRKRRSMGSASEGFSTDSEWDKVEAEAEVGQ